MSKASNYYYEQLNKEQQKAYYAMKEGLLNQQDSFAVPMLDKKELSDIYFMVRMDCPEIFYSVRFSYRYYPDSTAVEFRRVSKSLQDRRRDWMKRGKSCLSMILSYKMCGMTN